MITICIPTTPERNDRLKELLQSIHENTDGIDYRILIYPNRLGGWVKAVHTALDGIDGYVVLLGSDTKVQHGWLKILHDKFFEAFPNGDGIAQPYDEFHNGQLAVHPFGHSKTIKKYLNKSFIHCFSDNDMTDCLKMDGKYVYVPEAKIEHLHAMNGKAPVDETYKTIYNPETMERDRQVYLQRKKQRDETGYCHYNE